MGSDGFHRPPRLGLRTARGQGCRARVARSTSAHAAERGAAERTQDQETEIQPADAQGGAPGRHARDDGNQDFITDRDGDNTILTDDADWLRNAT